MDKIEYFKHIESKFYTRQNLLLAKEFAGLIKSESDAPFCHAFEIGCGFGLAANYVIEIASVITLSDIDNSAVEFVGWKYGQRCGLQSSNDIPHDADLIYFFMSLHHVEDWRALVERCLNHIIGIGGMVAICEIEPNPAHPFHVYEDTPHDGLCKSCFDWLRSYPQLSIKTVDFPSLSCRGVEYKCYGVIVKSKSLI